MSVTVVSPLEFLPYINSQEHEYSPKSVPTSPIARFRLACQHLQCVAQCSTQQVADEANPRYLIASPYDTPANFLDLTTLDKTNQLLAKALVQFRPIRPDYATAPYELSFNWDEIMAALRKLLKDEQFEWNAEQHFYVVQFRSQRKADADLELMGKLDIESHREAMESGGLLKYWFGQVDDDRRNLATCVWRSQADAKNGGLGPWHQKARAATRSLYDSINAKMRRLIISEGAETWQIQDW